MLLELFQVLPNGPQEGSIEGVRKLLHYIRSNLLLESPFAFLKGMKMMQ